MQAPEKAGNHCCTPINGVVISVTNRARHHEGIWGAIEVELHAF